MSILRRPAAPGTGPGRGFETGSTHPFAEAIINARVNGEWQDPELVISQFAGESSIDNEGNVYFTHHFFNNGVMLEADIYVAYRK